MNEDAKRYRSRAGDCRNIARTARDDQWRDTLLSMARDFEDEADRLDAEEQKQNNNSA